MLMNAMNRHIFRVSWYGRCKGVGFGHISGSAFLYNILNITNCPLDGALNYPKGIGETYNLYKI